MVEITKKVKRYLKVKIGGLVLELEPPKMKTLKKMVSLADEMQKNADEEAIDQLSETALLILRKNRKGEEISQEFVEELEFDEIQELVEQYFSWITAVQSDPN